MIFLCVSDWVFIKSVVECSWIQALSYFERHLLLTVSGDVCDPHARYKP